MFTACPGNLGRSSVMGGYYVGRKIVKPQTVAQQMNYKGQPSGPRLKQRTVVTDGFSKKKRKR